MHGYRRWVTHLLARLQSWFCRVVLLLTLVARSIVLVRGKSGLGYRRQHWSSVSIRHVFTSRRILQLLVQAELCRSSDWIQTLAILAMYRWATWSTTSEPRALRIRPATMPMQLLKLLVILLCMLLLRCRLVILVCAALADKAALL